MWPSRSLSVGRRQGVQQFANDWVYRFLISSSSGDFTPFVWTIGRVAAGGDVGDVGSDGAAGADGEWLWSEQICSLSARVCVVLSTSKRVPLAGQRSMFSA